MSADPQEINRLYTELTALQGSHRADLISEVATKILAVLPADVYALYCLAMAQYQIARTSASDDDFTRMKQTIQRALAAHPTVPDFYYLMYHYYLWYGGEQYTKARDCLLSAISLSPQTAEYYRQLGEIYLINREADKAVKNLRQAVELSPLTAEYRSRLALGLLRQHKIQESVAVAEQALADGPDDMRVLDTVGMIYILLGDLEKADKFFRDAIQRDPTYNYFHQHMDWIKRELQDREQRSSRGQKYTPLYIRQKGTERFFHEDDQATPPNQIDSRDQPTSLPAESRSAAQPEPPIDTAVASIDDRLKSARAALDGRLIADLKAGKSRSIGVLWTAFSKFLSLASPEQYAKLNPPANFKDFEAFALETGYRLPDNLIQLYKRADGGVCDVRRTNCILSLEFIPMHDVIAEWKMWRSVEQGLWLDGDEPTYPAGAIKNSYANPKWIPIARDGGGNCIGIDLDPGSTGIVGQVINFGRDEMSKFVIAPSLEDFIGLLLMQFAAGNIKLVPDVDYAWYIGSDSSHLTDGLRQLIVPNDFVPKLTKQDSSLQPENLGIFYYDEYSGSTLSQSFTVSVERLGSEIAIQTGNDELRNILRHVTQGIDARQDAVSYRKDLANLLPATIGQLRLRV